MNSRLAIKVGLFVAIGLVLLAALLMSFSKGFSFFTPTYAIDLKADSVGGLKKNANVLLSGVPVGKVSEFDVAPSGKGVIIKLLIEDRFKDRIHADARFGIEQLGLLGDQYVEITPTENKQPPLSPGATVQSEEPLSIQGTARSAKDLITQASDTLKTINEILTRANKTILTEQSLSNIAVALDNFGVITKHAADVTAQIDNLIQTNTPTFGGAVSNMVRFSQELNSLSIEMSSIVATNGPEFNKAVKNLENTSEILERLAKNLEAGKGLAGMVLKDEAFQAQFFEIATNLATFSRNLREHNLLHALFFKPKEPEPPKEKKK
jgi:phospholipid/cholesterol/gamma-HCH transport system substrate-binding protein